MSELYHHQIEGGEWGVRHGPPYPLAPEDHSPEQIRKNPAIKAQIKAERKEEKAQKKSEKRFTKMLSKTKMFSRKGKSDKLRDAAKNMTDEELKKANARLTLENTFIKLNETNSPERKKKESLAKTIVSDALKKVGTQLVTVALSKGANALISRVLGEKVEFVDPLSGGVPKQNESKSESKSEQKPKNVPKQKSEQQSKSESKPKDEPKQKSEQKPKSESKPKDEPKQKSEPKSKNEPEQTSDDRFGSQRLDRRQGGIMFTPRQTKAKASSNESESRSSIRSQVVPVITQLADGRIVRTNRAYHQYDNPPSGKVEYTKIIRKAVNTPDGRTVFVPQAFNQYERRKNKK